MTFQNKKILITGGVGFIGSHLADELLKHNPKKIILFDNLRQSSVKNIKHLKDDKRVEFAFHDVSDYGKVEEYVSKSDIVFHLAAGNVGNSLLDPDRDLQSNIVGTYNVLWAVNKYKKRMIYSSSGSVVSQSTPYAISKLAAENYCKFFAKEYGTKVSILRYHHVFGERQSRDAKCGVVNIFFDRVLRGFPPIVWGNGTQIKSFTYVKDVVDATLLVAEKDEDFGEVYDVASDTRISIKDLAHLLIDKYAKDKTMQPIYDKPKVGENMALNPDTTKIKELGWNIGTSFEEGLDKCKEWVEGELKKE